MGPRAPSAHSVPRQPSRLVNAAVRGVGSWPWLVSCSPRQRRQRLPRCVFRLTREPVPESPKKKRWEAPSSLHPPRGAGSAARGGSTQAQRGTPGAGGAGRARGSSFAKFGNRNVFMKDNSSSSSTDSRSRSSSRSPTRHFRRRCGGSGGSRWWAHLPDLGPGAAGGVCSCLISGFLSQRLPLGHRQFLLGE